MPFGDGTGPMGVGPMTGRAAGYCAGFAMPGYMNPYAGRGFWRRGGGRGFGRGRRNWNCPPVQYGYPVVPFQPTTEQELSTLRQQSEDMQNALEDINERIKELESKKSKQE